MRVLIALLLASIGGAFEQAQSAPSTSPQEARIAALSKLNLWVGEWKGSGWTEFPGTPRFEFDLVETVTRKVGGTVLLAEGKGTRKLPTGELAITHDGLALLYFDERTGRYLWHGHDLPWGTIEAEATLLADGFSWQVHDAHSGSTLRFIIHVDEHRWHETGEVKVDGGDWSQFMEMTLERSI